VFKKIPEGDLEIVFQHYGLLLEKAITSKYGYSQGLVFFFGIDTRAKKVYYTHIVTHMGNVMKRTNIMLSDDQHRKLKRYAKREGRTLGGLVRDALDIVYKKKDRIEQRKQVALSAYQEGFISMGKLAEVLGIDPISTRDFLKEEGIPIRSQDLENLTQDFEHA
jgi:predicted HTH domain antitoxin